MPNDTNENRDLFADIAAQEVTYRSVDLIEPEPAPVPDTQLPVGETDEAHLFEPLPNISDARDLEAELERRRTQYAPFMSVRSPSLPQTRIAVPLSHFDWRVQTAEDRRDFGRVLNGSGEWREVSIPHFGEPVGRATTYYRRTVEITAEQIETGSAFVCFKGVDYKAHVFMNSSYLGSHEGFFAPFEMDCTAHVHPGENVLVVRVDNDFISMGNRAWGDDIPGDKIYAATGPGYDDPEVGWHHCPPGMGIYQDVRLEFRPTVFVGDLYVRPLPEERRAEVRFEVYQTAARREELTFSLSVYGRNFTDCVVQDMVYRPSVIHECGVGDALQIALAKAAGTYRKPTPLRVGPGVNRFTISVDMGDFREWSPDAPWLYQAQVSIRRSSPDTVTDAAEVHFGMRSFRMDEEGAMKGGLFLNGRPIRLRGANTMGHEQQCVMRKDFDQLRDDILLARICNMNFLRITQRPVQSEVYDYCDMLGLMTQTDLPTFAVLPRNQYVEALRQVGEMERLVRPHPCNVMISYINEPLNNSGNEPHRYLDRNELEEFFESADRIVRGLNPERVIKACDGDYDPPSPGLQDRHCYCTWYNGQGVDIGRLHKGYWQPTKAGWYYGCGEFGAEGLEHFDLMRRAYPADWLPRDTEDGGTWTPNRITGAQTGRFHYFFFETPESPEEWIAESQAYQARAMRMMAEAFRRDNRMVSFAVHLFIDAFPSGWMKTIMDCERRPKRAFFAYHNALAPLLPMFRTDRHRAVSGETLDMEAWVANDSAESYEGYELRYTMEHRGEVIASGHTTLDIPASRAVCLGRVPFVAPRTEMRDALRCRLAVVDRGGEVVHDNDLEIELFPPPGVEPEIRIAVVGEPDGAAHRLARELQATVTDESDVYLIDDLTTFAPHSEAILRRVADGARLVVLSPAPGEYELAGHRFRVKESGFNPLHFASRRTGHRAVDGFRPRDFSHWYDPRVGYITPILHATMTSPDGVPILLTGNADDEGRWTGALAAAEFGHGRGAIYVNLVDLAGRTSTNPPARQFARRLLSRQPYADPWAADAPSLADAPFTTPHEE